MCVCVCVWGGGGGAPVKLVGLREGRLVCPREGWLVCLQHIGVRRELYCWREEERLKRIPQVLTPPPHSRTMCGNLHHVLGPYIYFLGYEIRN